MRKIWKVAIALYLIAYLILIIGNVKLVNYYSNLLINSNSKITTLEKENNGLEEELEALKNDFNSLQKENEALKNDFNSLQKENEDLQNQVLAFSAVDNFQAIFYSYFEMYFEETQILDYIKFPYYLDEDSSEPTEISIDSSLLSLNYLEITGIVIKDLKIKYNNELVYRYPIDSSRVIEFECESGIKYRISLDSTFYEQDNPIVTVTSINGITYNLRFSFYESPN